MILPFSLEFTQSAKDKILAAKIFTLHCLFSITELSVHSQQDNNEADVSAALEFSASFSHCCRPHEVHVKEGRRDETASWSNLTPNPLEKQQVLRWSLSGLCRAGHGIWDLGQGKASSTGSQQTERPSLCHTFLKISSYLESPSAVSQPVEIWDLVYITKNYLNHIMNKILDYSLSVMTQKCEASQDHYEIAMVAMKNQYKELENEIVSLTGIFVYKQKTSKYVENRMSTYSRIIRIRRELELGKLISGLPFFSARHCYCRKPRVKSSCFSLHNRTGGRGEVCIL